eukprot:GHVQ01006084.1.p1 GENE.GHVQ01006084.1~~GHVQ01006084.1.p1  ORF type:complete len:173 (-),score=4.22 GHVQ01006084.1:722-1240(-)
MHIYTYAYIYICIYIHNKYNTVNILASPWPPSTTCLVPTSTTTSYNTKHHFYTAIQQQPSHHNVQSSTTILYIHYSPYIHMDGSLCCRYSCSYVQRHPPLPFPIPALVHPQTPRHLLMQMHEQYFWMTTCNAHSQRGNLSCSITCILITQHINNVITCLAIAHMMMHIYFHS